MRAYSRSFPFDAAQHAEVRFLSGCSVQQSFALCAVFNDTQSNADQDSSAPDSSPQVTERLKAIDKLMKAHGVRNTAQLLRLAEESSERCLLSIFDSSFFDLWLPFPVAAPDSMRFTRRRNTRTNGKRASRSFGSSSTKARRSSAASAAPPLRVWGEALSVACVSWRWAAAGLPSRSHGGRRQR